MTPVDTTAVVDLLGVLAYAELTAFDRLAEDARLAPTLTGRAVHKYAQPTHAGPRNQPRRTPKSKR